MPKISEEKLEEIRQAADIVSIIGEYVPLTQKGKNYLGVCPFHQDHSPSMSVSREKQMFKCFACGVGGNVFKFVSDIESVGYLEAVSIVAQKLGLNFSYSSSSPRSTKNDHLYEIMNFAMLFYENNLDSIKGTLAREYLKNRGLNEKMLQTFNIGLSFLDNGMYEFLKKKGKQERDLLTLGLVNQNGLECRDVFQNRILFPIHDPEGRVVGFTGRIFESDRGPKYLNSRETVIFKKGNVLFNYHRARDAIRLQKKVILVEGNMDAIRMYSSGIENTIALMGTSITKEQVTLLQKLRVPVLLMFDNDDAGAFATYHNGEILENAGILVEVVRLSHEKDPDEYILHHGIQAMKDNISHAISFLEFKLNYLKENKNLEDSSELANYVKDVLKTLEGKDAITVDVTLNKLVQEYHLSLDVLKSELKEVTPKIVEVVNTPKPSSKKSRYDISACQLLYAMMNDKKYILLYQKKLGFFKEETYRGIANEIVYFYEKRKDIKIADFLIYAEMSPLKEEIYEIISSIKEDDLEDTKVEDYIFNILEITWNERIKELKKELKVISDVLRKEKISEEIIELKNKVEEIRKERSVKND